MRHYYVYLMANISRMLYVGVTNDLQRRVDEHKQGLCDGYTRKYRIKKLVCYELYNDPRLAIAREKQIKGWLRCKKLALIESENPHWKDLSHEWYHPSRSGDAEAPRPRRKVAQQGSADEGRLAPLKGASLRSG